MNAEKNINPDKSQIYFATCSWKYDSWKGIIYPDEKKFNWLEEYAKHFKSVEIDQWFWSLFDEKKIGMPKKDDVINYSNSVPEDFKFTIKMPNSITLTHFYKKKKADPLIANPHFFSPKLMEDFLEIIEPMKNKIGALMFQFEYLNREKMSSQTEFLDRLENFLTNIERSLPLAIEIRNPNYLNKNYFEFIDREKLSHVFLHGYYMPSAFEIYSKFNMFVQRFSVLRLHGPDRSGIEELTDNTWDKIVQPKDEELNKIVEMILSLKRKEVDIFINVNNHYEGSAPLTIAKLKKELYSIE